MCEILRFHSNQVRLALSLLAYNMGNLWRRLALPRRIKRRMLRNLPERGHLLPSNVVGFGVEKMTGQRPLANRAAAA
jgi:hypothetical protein